MSERRVGNQMTMNDPIADMLTRIRNAGHAGHRRVDMPVSKLKIELGRILTENHFIHGYKVLDDGRHGVLRVYMKYTEDERPVIRSLKRARYSRSNISGSLAFSLSRKACERLGFIRLEGAWKQSRSLRWWRVAKSR